MVDIHKIAGIFPFINFFGYEVYTYAIFIGLAFVAASIIFLMFGTKYAHVLDLIELCFYLCVNSIIAAKIVFLISAIPDIIADPAYLNACILEGGFTFAGGLVGGLLTGLFMCWRRRMSIPRVMSSFLMATALGHAILKVGCMYNGCCYGLEYEGLFAIAIEGVGSTFPIQMIESITSLAIFVLLFVLFLKVEFKEESKVHIYFMLIYPVVKFIIEFFRGDAVRGVFILSMSQWLCIFIFAIGLIFGIHALATRPKKQASKVEYIKMKKPKTTE